MEISYPHSFEKLLQSFDSKNVYNYIGQGNPASNILIIGNECTAEDTPPEFHYTHETKENFEKWQAHCANNEGWEAIQESEKFDPLCPWKGWKYRGNWKAEGRDSSKTWNAYQEFINYLLPPSLIVNEKEQYNFWQHCFITELSTNNQKHSSQIRDDATAKSIEVRLKSEAGILRADFFQEFPIIILGCYHYKDLYKIDIPKCFNQTYIGLAWKHERLHEFIHAHRHISEDGKPHLLLHTNHFAMRSHDFIKAVADECKKFIDKYGISILKSAK